jgi:hypothetical protein
MCRLLFERCSGRNACDNDTFVRDISRPMRKLPACRYKSVRTVTVIVPGRLEATDSTGTPRGPSYDRDAGLATLVEATVVDVYRKRAETNRRPRFLCDRDHQEPLSWQYSRCCCICRAASINSRPVSLASRLSYRREITRNRPFLVRRTLPLCRDSAWLLRKALPRWRVSVGRVDWDGHLASRSWPVRAVVGGLRLVALIDQASVI